MANRTYDGNVLKNVTTPLILIGLMVRESIRQQAVNVSNLTATKIPAVPLSNRLSIIIINNSTNTIYLGDSTVTTSNGFPIFPRGAIRIEIDDNIDIYGIADTAVSGCRIIEGA